MYIFIKYIYKAKRVEFSFNRFQSLKSVNAWGHFCCIHWENSLKAVLQLQKICVIKKNWNKSIELLWVLKRTKRSFVHCPLTYVPCHWEWCLFLLAFCFFTKWSLVCLLNFFFKNLVIWSKCHWYTKLFWKTGGQCLLFGWFLFVILECKHW